MKLKYLIFSVLGTMAAASMTSCYEMDTAPMSGYVTDTQKSDAKAVNADLAQSSITGITAIFSTYATILGYHNDFGFGSVMLGNDCRSIDMVNDDNGYNWFSEMAEMDYGYSKSYLTQYTWGNCYNQIKTANDALKGLDPETEDGEMQFYLAQARAIRAYDYFLLAQSYQFTYKGNEDKPCVMIITEENESEVAFNGCPRSTVQEVYDFIMEDINAAIELLEGCGVKPEKLLESKPKRLVSLATAYGIRARVNLVMQNWEAAAADAEAAIANFSGRPKTISEASKPTFTYLSESDWMWGIAIAETDRVVTSWIINWPSHLGSLNYGYASVGAWRQVNKALFNSIPETDARRGWFLDENGQSVNLTEAQQAYCDESGMPEYTQVKFGPYNDEVYTTTNANDIPLMRVEEMYLILAEATAMAGGDGATILTDFISTYRDPSYSFSGSGADVQEEVLRQRRIELYGEGLTYFDFMRLNKDFDRRGGGWPTNLVFNVEAGSDILLLMIPESEINGNKQFTSADNNAPASMPNTVKDYE